MAGGQLPTNTGYRPPDALNLWPAILDGGAGPRTEVVHQVENQWSCDVTQSGGGCCSSMRLGDMKLKKYLFEVLEEYLKDIRKRREDFAKDIAQVEQIISEGTARAREITDANLRRVKKSMGIYQVEF